jgi:hypothetical protein
MRTDDDIKRDVEDEIRWDPDIDATDIAVAARDGVVTLTGFVRSYNEKFAAEIAAKRVAGVVGVANDIASRCVCRTWTRDPIPRSRGTPSRQSRLNWRSPRRTSR